MQSLSDIVKIYAELDANDDSSIEVMLEFTRRSRNLLTLMKVQNKTNKEYPHELAKAWIGIAVQPVLPNLARHLGTPSIVGFRVTRVYPETLAAQSELEPGDIILSLNGNDLRPRGMQDVGMLHRQVRRLDIGDTADLSVLRDGTELQVQVTLERTRLTKTEVKREENEDFGLTVREITFFDRDENRWPRSISGVLIEAVDRAGWAQLGSLQKRDLILKINGQSIENTQQFNGAMETLTRAKQERVIFVVLRGVETRYQYLEPDWSPHASKLSQARPGTIKE